MKEQLERLAEEILKRHRPSLTNPEIQKDVISAMCEMYEKGVQSIGGLQEEWRWILDNCDYDSGGGHWYFNGTPYFTDEIIEVAKIQKEAREDNVTSDPYKPYKDVFGIDVAKSIEQ